MNKVENKTLKKFLRHSNKKLSLYIKNWKSSKKTNRNILMNLMLKKMGFKINQSYLKNYCLMD